MDKTYRDEYRRIFLLQNLPEPVERSSSHLQIFDNYIENTRLRIRSVRSPETKQWSFVLQQRFPVNEQLSHWKNAEIYINETEHKIFEPFENREIKKNERVESNEVRKNRYFLDYEGKQISIDLFLGDLWGLILAKAEFETEKELLDFETPPFSVLEVTGDPFFTGGNLVGKTFADIQSEFKNISESQNEIEIRILERED
jgi:CYTH domain-containing protein